MTAPGEPLSPEGSFHKGRLTRTVTAEATSTFAVYGLDRFIQLGVIAVLARLLTPNDYGVVAAASVFLAWIAGLSQMGVSLSLVKARQLTPQLLTVGQTILASTSLLFFLLIQLGAPFIGTWYHNPEVALVFRALGITVLLQAMSGIPEVLLLRQLRARDLRLIEVISSAASCLFVAIPLAYFGFGYWSLVALTVSQATLKAIMLQIATKYSWKFGFDWSIAKDLTFQGSALSAMVIINLIAKTADNLLVGLYMSAQSLGIYSRAYTLMALPTNLYTQVADRVIFPAVSRVQHEPERLRRAFLQGISLTALLGIPATVLMVITAPEIISILLGARWLNTIGPFIAFSTATYFRLSYKSIGSMILGAGPVSTMVFSQAVYALSVVAACLVSYPHGVVAVAGAVSAAIILNWTILAGLAFSRIRMSVWDFARAHIPGISLAVLLVLTITPIHFLCVRFGLRAPATLGLTLLGTASVVALAALSAPIWFVGEHGKAAVSAGIQLARQQIHRVQYIFRRR